MPRYVILEHLPGPAGPRERHWDLMLEAGELLRTWALAGTPSPGATIDATALPDHRPMYLEYEGPVSGDRGTVTRFDRGEYQTLHESPLTLSIKVKGALLHGRVNLYQAGDDRSRWICQFTAD